MPDTYVNAERLGYFKDKVDEKIEADLSSKADKTGSYPDLTAGNAAQLIGTVYTEDKTPYKFRTTGGSIDVGNRADDTIVGGSLVWNQIVQNGNFADGTNRWSIQNATASASENVLTVTPSGTSNQSVVSQGKNIKAHVYLGVATIKNGALSGTTSLQLRDSDAVRTISTTSAVGAWVSIAGMYKATTANSGGYIRVLFPYLSNIDGVTFMVKKINIFDLTQMFGPTIADYIYSLEQATAGAGVAWFRKLFPDDYYPYNPGEIMSVSGLTSHDMVGFNLWDEEWEIGTISTQTGANVSATGKVRSKNYIPVLPSTEYHLSGTSSTTTTITDYLYYYDADQNFIGKVMNNHAATVNKTFTTPSNAHYMRFIIQDDTNPGDICINLSWSGYRNGEYEPYVKHSYPLDSTLTLRGIPKLDANNNLYYDGDTYESDGTVTRKYGIVDLGTLTWLYTSNTHRMYSNGLASKLKTPASSTAVGVAICQKYVIDTDAHTASNYADKTIAIGGSNGMIYVYDSSYTDAETFKAAMSGVYLVYELATPTTESAAPYTNPQIVDDFGTEEYVTDSIVPVGHITKYPENLRDKLQHLPDLASTDGSYLLTQSNKKMSLSPYVAPTFPAPDTTLSVEGGYAEAKSVGDEISGLKEDLDELPDNSGTDAENVDLDITDENGNSIARFANGGIQTKEFNSSEVMSDLNDLSDVVAYEVGKNLVDPDKKVDGGIQSNGTILATDTWSVYGTSDYIMLDDDTDYAFSIFNYTGTGEKPAGDQRLLLLLFDENKSPISNSYQNVGNAGTLTFNSGSDAKFVRVSGRKSYNFQLVKGTTTGQYIPYDGKNVISMPLGVTPMGQAQCGNVLFGKKWAVCGDSFTAGATSTKITSGKYVGRPYVYPYLIANRNNMEILKFFNGGQTLAFPAEPGTFTNSLTNPNGANYYQNIPEDVDYITIYLGINDANHSSGSSQDGEETTGYIPLGEITDATTVSYYGAWNVVLTWLISNRPHAHIGIIVTNGNSNDDYRQAQIAIAKKYGLPYIDLNGDERTPSMHRTSNPDIASAVKTALLEKWRVSSSNTHPNDAAYLFESTFIENFLRSI